MAHRKKKTNPEQPSQMDQILWAINTLAGELKTMKTEIQELKSWQQIVPKDTAVQPDAVIDTSTSHLETPWKVVQIEKIVEDESFVWEHRSKKIYSGLGRTFKNKAEASAYYDRVTKNNPWAKYDIYPV